MSETEASTFDAQQLRRGLRDLAALSALPIVWTGSDPRRIAESLADALLHMLHLEIVYILVRDRAYEIPVEVAHTARGPAPRAQAEEIGRALAPWLKTNGLSRTPSSIANPLGNGMTRIICPPFGIEARGGVLVACSPRADFPTEVDRLLLSVAANQVAVLLDRRRTEDALRESEERFRGMFENAGVGIADCDLQGRFLRVNQKLCEIVGYSREELLEKTWQDITHPDDLAASLDQFLALLRGEKPVYSLEKRLVRKDGLVVWIDLAVSLRRDAAGAPAYVIAILQDISERKRLEEELRKAHARLEFAVRGSQITIIEVDVPDGVLENSRWKLVSVGDQMGYDDRSGSEIDFATGMAHVHPDDLERVVRAMRAHLSGQARQYEAEFRVQHRDGSYYWRLARGVAVRDAEGRAIRFMISSVDITGLKRAEEALRESEERFRGTFENAAVGIAHTDPEGRFLRVNEKFCAIVGYPREELLEKTWHDITHPDDLAASIDVSAAALRGESPGLPLEKRYLRKDGSLVWVELFVSLQRDVAGAPGYLIAIIQDISQRKRLEEALRESERRFRILTEALPHWVWTARPDGALDYINSRTFEYTGSTPEQFRDWDWRSYVHPEDLPRCFELWARSIATGEPYEIEHRLLRADGVFRWHVARALALRDDSGRITRWLGSCADIDDQKRAQEALRASEQQFRTFVDHATDAFFLQDDQLVVVDVNRQACQSLGYTRDELVGMTPLDFDPDVTPAMLEEFGRRLDTGEMLVFESRHRRKDGSVFPVEVRGRPFWEGGRRLTVALALDITEHKRAEEALRESERRFRILAEALPHMVWTAQPDGATDYYNARTTEYTGLTSEQLRGWGWRSTIHPEDLPRCLELWTRSIATGEPYEIEFQVRRADGAFGWHLARALSLRDESGRITKWFGSCIDIDDQKRAQETLREAKEAAEAANRAKDEFLANVSHEIRTPMNAILGMTELVMDTPLTRDQRQCLKTVKSAADNLLGLMNDLLDFSKIEAGKLELAPDDFSLRAAVGDTLRALAVRAHTKGLELIYDVQPEVPDAVVGDAGRLRQVLLNLVGNALKFTDAGEVVVRVEVAGAAAPEGEVGLRFTVRDTGMGIPRDQHERIFRAFEQEDSSTTRRFGGTGLGLTIAARLVALMHGQITVESEPGRGSTFAFTARLGLQPQAPDQDPLRPPVLLHGLPVLVVDDNATNRQILEEWLRGWQMEPAAVGDGLAALDALWDAVSVGRPYALVLLDARMPDTDGLALAAKIRKRAELAATRIILLTSGERPGDWERIRERRIDSQLLKPVQQDELLETIYRVMNRANGDAPRAARPIGGREPAPASVPAASPLHILVAEDNEINAQLLERLLARRGHRVRLANNGRDALALAEEGAFDLLLLDVHMPELDGFQVIQAIRERERSTGGHLPVIALTARARQEDRERCLAAGMDDFLAKPIQAADLWEATERLTSSRPPADRPRPGLLTPRVLLAACGGDAATLEEICQVLRARLPAQLTAVHGALRDRDAIQLREASHKLCGTVAPFSTLVGAVASDLEDQAAQGQLEKASPLVEQLEAIARELIQQVDGLSIQALRDQAGAADDRDRTTSP
jgi:two-component system, sensor histidine kinase and response regulator